MKKIAILFVLAITGSIFTACNNSSNATTKIKSENLVDAEKRDAEIEKGSALVSFDKTEYNFGTVNEGDIVETTFVVTNAGKNDLVISNAVGSCGCTVPTWPKEAIKPGESADVFVKFNTSGKPNRQTKTVTLTTNTATGREVLKLTGSVIPKAK